MSRIDELEKEMLNLKQEFAPVEHTFGPGVYVRQVTLPAGNFAIGHKQKKEHLNVFLKGRVTMYNNDGTTTELKAPMMFTGKPGRKIGFVHEEVVWLNIYPTDEQDIEKLEETYLDKSEAFLESEQKVIEQKNREAIESLKFKLDTEDYELVVKESGFTKEEIQTQVENKDDLIPMPAGTYKFKKGKSAIHGQGIFAASTIAAGEIIGPARIEGKRTAIGRFTNHSMNPNAEMVQGEGTNIYLKSLYDLKGCRGGFDGDEITIDYRQALKLNREIGQCQV